MSNPAKVLRQQVRQVVLDLLPELVKKELVLDMETRLRKEMNDRLEVIDQKQRDLQAYFIRNSLPNNSSEK